MPLGRSEALKNRLESRHKRTSEQEHFEEWKGKDTPQTPVPRRDIRGQQLPISRKPTSELPLGIHPGVSPLDTALRIVHAPRELYHYTSLHRFVGIISSRTIWASSIFHLNDAAEFLYTITLAGSVLLTKTGEQPRNKFYKRLWKDRFRMLALAGQIFVVSFSENPDLLSQWRAYTGGGSGVSIGFQHKYLLTRALTQHFRLVKCVYDPQIQKRIVKKLIERAYIDFHKDAMFEMAALRYFMRLVSVASAFKHPSFREEREWRLVSDFMHAPPFQRGYSTKWRPGQFMLIPYTEFKLSNKKERIVVSSLYLGPTPHRELSTNSVQSILASEASGDRKLKLSSVPYRNW